ncbi:MAG: sensor histidine kinase [Ginsengibacter sp.]
MKTATSQKVKNIRTKDNKEKIKQSDLHKALSYANNMLKTVRQPFLLLYPGLKIYTANESFYKTFKVQPKKAEGKLIYKLNKGQWEIPLLKKLLEKILSKKTMFRDFEVEHFFKSTGHKKMLFNARRMDIPGSDEPIIMLAIEDVNSNTTKDHVNETIEQLANISKQKNELASHLQDVREEERATMAREIHDELGQQLTAVKMDMSWLYKKINSADQNIKEKVKSTITLIDDTINTVRRIATELRPSILDDLGLVYAIEWHVGEFEKRADIKVEYNTNCNDLEIPSKLSIAFFRILQESFTNIARHANATNVQVSLMMEERMLTLSIEDNGSGFDADKKQKNESFGLMGIKERTLMIGGEYLVKSKPGSGTKVLVTVPLIA